MIIVLHSVLFGLFLIFLLLIVFDGVSIVYLVTQRDGTRNYRSLYRP